MKRRTPQFKMITKDFRQSGRIMGGLVLPRWIWLLRQDQKERDEMLVEARVELAVEKLVIQRLKDRFKNV